MPGQGPPEEIGLLKTVSEPVAPEMSNQGSVQVEQDSDQILLAKDISVPAEPDQVEKPS